MSSRCVRHHIINITVACDVRAIFSLPPPLLEAVAESSVASDDPEGHVTSTTGHTRVLSTVCETEPTKAEQKVMRYLINFTRRLYFKGWDVFFWSQQCL